MIFFAGANTRNGFVSLFDDAFSDVERLYILKGSSGCGKSTLMKRISATARKQHHESDTILCSADPESLDGVIIPDLNIAIADGTAPHILDVKYPCVRETIINLGQFWDEKLLLPRKKEIIELTDKKARHYKNAYKALHAVGMASDVLQDITIRNTDKYKLDQAAFKLAEKIIGEKHGKRKSVFASSFSSSGFKTAEVFDRVKSVYRIIGKAANLMISAILQIAAEQNADMIIAHSPIDPKIPEAIYFPESEIVVTASQQSVCKEWQEEKSVSTSRFVDSTGISEAKIRFKGMEKLIHELLTDAQKELYYAKSVHNEIESIYIPAMNFKLLDDYTVDLMKGIFGK